MREEFEKLPEIATHLAHGNVFYSEEKSAYASEFSALHFVACYVNGAWMAWQEQQKRIDELQEQFVDLKEDIDLQEFLYQGDAYNRGWNSALLMVKEKLKKLISGGEE